MQDRKFELRSDEVQEILSLIPHWIIRWGITLIFTTILIVLLATWFIKYPEIITSRITITTQNPPVSVIAQSSGKLVKLFVKENEFVKANTYLGVIENPANIEDIFKLKNQLEAFKTFLAQSDKLIKFDLDEDLILGELQIDYSNFLQNYLEYKFLIQTNYHAIEIKLLEAQITSYKNLNNNLVRKKEILLKELELAQKKYNSDKILFEKALISDVDLANSESAYLQKKYSLENAETIIINNNMQLAICEKTITDLNQQLHDRKRRLILSIQASYKKLQSQIALWEQKYILKASIDGYIFFFKFWSDNQFVKVGDEVMTIVSSSRNIIGKIYLPEIGSGKVKIGQKVNIKFDSYPANEFGMVEGKIELISLISRDNRYLVSVRFLKGLQTSYNKTLEFKQEMQGNANIITEDLRLFERIFNQLRYVFNASISK